MVRGDTRVEAMIRRGNGYEPCGGSLPVRRLTADDGPSVTTDRTLRHQQNLTYRTMAIVVLSDERKRCG